MVIIIKVMELRRFNSKICVINSIRNINIPDLSFQVFEPATIIFFVDINQSFEQKAYFGQNAKINIMIHGYSI
jgi:hypothetical protein